MAMRWHLENWRKLYVGKSPAWLRLPVSARGLGFVLLTYCDDEGRIDIGEDAPGEAIAYLVGARPREHKRIAEDVEALLSDGYLVLDGSSLSIRNFAEAQDRTPAAKRTAEWRAKKDRETIEKAPAKSVTRISPGDVSDTSPSDESEPSPRDESVCAIRSESDPSPTRHDPPNPQGGRTGRAKPGPSGVTHCPDVDADAATVEAWLVRWDIPPVNDPVWGRTVVSFLDRHRASGKGWKVWKSAWRNQAGNAIGYGQSNAAEDYPRFRSELPDPNAPKPSVTYDAVYADRPVPPNPRLEAAMAKASADGFVPPPMPATAVEQGDLLRLMMAQAEPDSIRELKQAMAKSEAS